KRNHPGSKLRQGFWMVFRLGVNNWGSKIYSNHVSFTLYMLVTSQVLSTTSKLFFEQPTASFLV
ncbi:hypothetical protein, partial [Streptococcus pneumoniae]|uniref:hypothetical protein n=1 Tax=Streptococcus pneumoniae TaxID=1313 RepID=UPI001C5C9A4C